MKTNQKGFSAVVIILVIVVVGLIAAVGWLVYDRQNNTVANSELENTQQQQQEEEAEPEVSTKEEPELDVKSAEGIKYTVPTDWITAKGPFNDPEVEGSGQYLLSPDYKESGFGQLSIEQGAYINFHTLEWAGITKNTTIAEAAQIIKNGEGGYLDSDSVEVTKVGEAEVVMFNTGHTTDGVSVFHKTASGQWLSVTFSTITGGDGNYNAQDSSHYKTFQSWLATFIELN